MPIKVREGRKPRPPRRRQPSDREGRRRRPRAGLHRGHAGLETRRRAPPRRAHRAHRPRRAQGGQVELALLRQSRARAGSSTSIASRTTSRWLSSAARRCVLSPPASPSTRKCATSTSTRTTSSTRRRWRRGSGRRPPCPAGSRSAGPVRSRSAGKDPRTSPQSWSEHDGRQDVQEVGEGRKEGRRHAGRCEGGQTAERSPRHQPASPRRRRPCREKIAPERPTPPRR